MIAIKQTFRDIPVNLDGGTFVNCRFERCELIYSGTMPVTLNGCEFPDCAWRFLGPALATMQFMRGLYHGAGSGGKALIEQTFDSIRKPDAPLGGRSDPKIFN
jgi:hypothetical protein